jgi:thioredoxin reductase (NADPH)
MVKEYDVLIIGAGPAGMTAGLYAVRSGLKVGIISKDIGGTANTIVQLDNWPGFSGSGPKLMKQFYDQLNGYKIDFIMEEAKSIEKGNDFRIKTSKKEYISKAVIIATGTERKKLQIPGEKKLVGKGVSYCVTCDSFFFKDKIVGVVGGSDCAIVSALALSDIAKKVYVFYRGKELRCEKVNLEKLQERKNIEIVYDAIPERIDGKDKVEKIIVSEKEFDVDGIFIEIGAVVFAEFLKKLGLKMNKEEYIEVDENMKTSVEGVFACGDITKHKLKQVVVASGQGAIAGKSVYDWLRL